MAHFAEIDESNTVVRVLVVADEQEHRGQEFLSQDLGLGGTWVQTSYNANFGKKFAGISDTFDGTNFKPAEPEENLGFDEETWSWIMPEQEVTVPEPVVEEDPAP